MLGYLEQMPLYNAANFSWVGRDGPGLCHELHGLHQHPQRVRLPVRRLSPTKTRPWVSKLILLAVDRGDQQLFCLHGHNDCLWRGGTPTPPGVFTQGGKVYGVQNITDGTSNTIAFGESLIGDGTIETVRWRDGPIAQIGRAALAAGAASTTSARIPPGLCRTLGLRGGL